jgi:hypothetical protein
MAFTVVQQISPLPVSHWSLAWHCLGQLFGAIHTDWP